MRKPAAALVLSGDAAAEPPHELVTDVENATEQTPSSGSR
jgi:hypothetical protein